MKKIKRWRAEDVGLYYYINSNNILMRGNDNDYTYDAARFNSGNYFRTSAQCEEFAKRVKKLAMEYHEEIQE